jgi:hypothetical protein
MAMLIGQRIPSPYYEKLMDRVVAHVYVRACRTCKYEYPTAEIPVWSRFPRQSVACCPVHPDTISPVVMRCNAKRAVLGKYQSHGLLKIILFGGLWRRRQFPVPGCVDSKGKPTRWTTGEFMADGAIVGDVAVCPRCGGDTTIKLGTTPQGRVRTRRAWANLEQRRKRKNEKEAKRRALNAAKQQKEKEHEGSEESVGGGEAGAGGPQEG